MLETGRRSLPGEPSGRPARFFPAVRGVCTALAVPPGVVDTVLVDLSSYTIVELDGSIAGGGNPGRILHVVHPGMTNSSGLWSTGYQTSILERPVFAVLLVSGFTGGAGDDLDEGDDGVLDTTPWSAIVDSVAFSDGTLGALTYGAPVLGPGFDGDPTAPGCASRFPYYTDTDSAADWKRNDFDGEGLPDMPGTLVAGEARNTPGTVNRVALEDYYANVDPTRQAALRSTIHAAISTHLRFPYTANTTDTWDILNIADQDPVDSGAILDIYQNETNTKIAGGMGAYNREHSWPNSYGFNNNEAGAEYTDCHHLFASDVTYNSNRGNKYFGICTAGCTENATLLNHGFAGGSGTYPGNSNWSSASLYQIWGHMKGDLARAQLYMDVRYEGGTHPYTWASETNLILTDNTSLIATNAPYMGLLPVLLQWHLDDPVDAAERARNEVIESYQGNRNPFVDHPDWASCVFQGTGCQVVAASPTVTTIAATGAAGTVTGFDESFRTTCTGGRLYTLAPCRVLDTRNDSPMIDGVPRDVVFRDVCGIPPTALAVAANITVTQPSLPRYLSIYPAIVAPPGTSVVHFGAGRTRAATTIIKLSGDGSGHAGHARLEATVPTGGTTHVIVDVSGYFD